MLRLGAVVMKVSDVDRAGAFWSAVLGYARQPNNPAFLMPEGGPGTRLHLDDEERLTSTSGLTARPISTPKSSV